MQADEAEEGDPGDQGVERAGEASSGGKGSGCAGKRKYQNVKYQFIIVGANVKISNMILLKI